MTEEMLASWSDGPAKQAIVAFVGSVTTAGSGFVAPADRIATFDNDGTLWVEQPAPPQFDFIFGTWAKEVERDPSLASEQPYKAIIERDPEFFEGIATQDPTVVATPGRGDRAIVVGRRSGRVRRAGPRVGGHS